MHLLAMGKRKRRRQTKIEWKGRWWLGERQEIGGGGGEQQENMSVYAKEPHCLRVISLTISRNWSRCLAVCWNEMLLDSWFSWELTRLRCSYEVTLLFGKPNDNVWKRFSMELQRMQVDQLFERCNWNVFDGFTNIYTWKTFLKQWFVDELLFI